MKGYIKTYFREVTTKAKKSFIIGSITDGYYKLQVQITDHYEEEIINKLQRGLLILLTGRMKVPSNGIPHLCVSTTADVAFLKKERVMSFLLIMNGFRSIVSNHN